MEYVVNKRNLKKTTNFGWFHFGFPFFCASFRVPVLFLNERLINLRTNIDC